MDTSVVDVAIGALRAELSSWIERARRPLRAGRRTFISRAEVAALAAANVRIDRDQFRTDLDAVIDQAW
jgi:hypothetical protein